jgi:hypothetical protein
MTNFRDHRDERPSFGVMVFYTVLWVAFFVAALLLWGWWGWLG